MTYLNTEFLQSELSKPFVLPEGAVEHFNTYGYVKLKDVLSAELLSHYDSVITDLVFSLNKLTKPMEERTTYERAFLQVMNLWRESDEVKDFVFSARLAKIAADLLQVNGVRLYHDQALYKESSGGITPWHADQFYWPLSSPKTVTVWIPLQKTEMEMGPLAFAEKSHHVEIGRDLEISDESEAIMATQLKQFEVSEAPFDLGEVSFHAGWLFHRAGPNSSGRPRKVMTMIYMDQEQKIVQPRNEYQHADWETWLLSKPVGGAADSELNPVLFAY
ncbi:phytanoyl-CoA dioxygenase family protein [Dyadobacter arcticus]|uniref:Ectoine hydroxylase-related dioxygenase (Phytanoyl-CoA dioxygenase family) n=1 Tax=Dyadobacter arcticus TaxID=1078754 RepID=A0ABX0UHR7_9BACT|nr:phytanoyl-CoA dioxygenase family protein [Dyadobacter arcticus]NIJ51105.1 ectoine hydroxylase-related dioxygenase (phytanoyl-CoA dioxygenase family) [Dyadobacter arcticus]